MKQTCFHPDREFRFIARQISLYRLIWLLITILGITWSTAALARGGKKLIEFGWDEPDTAELRQNVRQMEQSPFGGVVLNAKYRDAHGAPQTLEWTGFSATPIAWEALQPALADLKSTRFVVFTDNFLRFNTSPGDVDWFDDFSAILHNAAMAARLSRQGHLKGILFDTEAYEHGLFRYPDQKYRQKYTFEQYAAQVRQRGEEVMNAFQTEFPNLTLFMTLGYNFAGSNPEDLQTNRYGLLAPFLDGLYTAARGRTVIVDGFESSYPYKSPDQFEQAYQTIKKGDLAVCAVPKRYLRRVSASFGLWMDYNSGRRPWNETDFSKNYFTPEQLESALAAALRRSDRYVWLYSQTPRWWPRKDLPDAYIDAVSRAEASVIPAAHSPVASPTLTAVPPPAPDPR